jgi:hypothetical protein
MSIGGPVPPGPFGASMPPLGLPAEDPYGLPPGSAAAAPGGKIVDRKAPEPDEARKQLVTKWIDDIKAARTFWGPAFRQMVKDQKFCAGSQWNEETKAATFNDQFDDRYVANVTLRHVKQRVAALYAKNPKAIAKPRPKLYATVWDGTAQTFKEAQDVLAKAQAAQQQMQKLVLGAGLGMAASQLGMGAAGAPGGASPLATLTGQPEYSWQNPPAGLPPDAPGLNGGGSPGPMPSGPPGAGPSRPGTPGGPPEPSPEAGMPPNGGGPPGSASPGPGGLMAMLQGAAGQAGIGLPQGPSPDEVTQAQAILEDARGVKAQIDQVGRIARTLEILYQYEVSQQQQSFKSRMKMTVRRATTSGVGWVRVGFQRVMARSPDLDSQLADAEQQLAVIERVSADIADNETRQDAPEAEQMRLIIAELSGKTDIVVREGLMFSWPKSTAIIPDKNCSALRNFLGCNWAAEEYCLTAEEIQQTYGIDVGDAATAYRTIDGATDFGQVEELRGATTGDKNNPAKMLVWEAYNKQDGLVYVVCDGYADFLREPAAPEYYTDAFWPWFLVAFNETEGKVFPPSDVTLIRSMQLELNRARQGLREHRFANRPKTAYAEGTLSEEDIEVLRNPPFNALVAVSGLQPGQDINQVLQGIKGVPVDPNIYTTQETFQDLLRVVGDQSADLGPTSGATATESNIASQARATATGSEIDDIDDTLSAIAQAAGQILLLNVSEETVKEIVGPGAIWPSLTKGDVARNLVLDIEAGSSGRPDQARELQNFERLAPILMQIPGITPIFMAKQAISRMDDSIGIEDAVTSGMPSILAQNGMQPGASTAPGGGPDPNAQGPQGASNNPAPPSPQSSAPTPMNSGPPGPPSQLN